MKHHNTLFASPITLRNMLQLFVCVDRRYGPTYKMGTYRETHRSLLRHGPRHGSRDEVVVLGWWPSDINVSDVIAGNNGALRGGATLGGGLIQQAFAFNGTSAFVEITNSAAMNLGTGAFPVSGWVNFFTTRGALGLV